MEEETKTLILMVSPSDTKIDELVQTWEEERGYAVETYTITDVDTTQGEIIKMADNHKYGIRALFTESAWGSIPRKNRCLLLDTLTIHPKIRWIHWSKKN